MLVSFEQLNELWAKHNIGLFVVLIPLCVYYVLDVLFSNSLGDFYFSVVGHSLICLWVIISCCVLNIDIKSTIGDMFCLVASLKWLFVFSLVFLPFIYVLLNLLQVGAIKFSWPSGVDVSKTILAGYLFGGPIEEWYFRGALYNYFQKRYGGSVSILGVKISYTLIMTTIVFACWHPTVKNALFALIVGAILCALRERTGNIFASSILHIMINYLGYFIRLTNGSAF